MIKDTAVTEAHSFSIKVWLTFLIPSIIGLLLFITPMSIDGEVSIPIAMLAAAFKGLFSNTLTTIVTTVVLASTLLTVITKLFQPKILHRYPFFQSLFDISWLWTIVRCIGAIFIVCCYFNVGPAIIHSSSTGKMVLDSLLPTLLAIFFLAGLLLPLLINFGLLELMGTLMTTIMRPLFNLPGRSAVDCIASWLGDGSVGILMTSKQYEAGYYTQREAATISTTFTIVSITFSLVIAAQVGLDQMFSQFYLTVCFAGFIAALIVPKLPPLRNKKDTFINGTFRDQDDEIIPAGHGVWSWGLHQALKKASTQNNPIKLLQDGLKNAIDMVFGVLPVIMAIGTIGLMVSEYTPVFHYLGMPFLPLLELLQIPDAVAASETMVVGFTDMFVPSILVASVESDMTRFVIAALSLTQLIYLSEVGALLLGSKIPVTLLELFMIFILRTVVTLPVIAGIAHWIF